MILIYSNTVYHDFWLFPDVSSTCKRLPSGRGKASSGGELGSSVNSGRGARSSRWPKERHMAIPADSADFRSWNWKLELVLVRLDDWYLKISWKKMEKGTLVWNSVKLNVPVFFRVLTDQMLKFMLWPGPHSADGCGAFQSGRTIRSSGKSGHFAVKKVDAMASLSASCEAELQTLWFEPGHQIQAEAGWLKVFQSFFGPFQLHLRMQNMYSQLTPQSFQYGLHRLLTILPWLYVNPSARKKAS